MSLETTTRIICDGCGATVEGKPVALSTRASASYWDAQKKAKASGWLVQERSYRRNAHYCQGCADKPQQPVKSATRPKKCQECRDIAKADKADKHPRRICMGYHRCAACGWKRKTWEYQ